MRVRTHTNPYHFFKRLPKLDLSAIFGTDRLHLDFEVGFGRGVFLRHYARLFPNRQIIGVEIRSTIVDILEDRLINESIHNVLPIHSSAILCLEDIVPNFSIENMFIFHPDPWFKTKHHKRRAVNAEFLELCLQKLMPGGRIYISTDVNALFDDIQSQFLAFPQFKAVNDTSFWDTIYKTHWNLYSVQTQRTEYFAVYVKGAPLYE